MPEAVNHRPVPRATRIKAQIHPGESMGAPDFGGEVPNPIAVDAADFEFN
jgi:hypothetical protein